MPDPASRSRRRPATRPTAWFALLALAAAFAPAAAAQDGGGDDPPGPRIERRLAEIAGGLERLVELNEQQLLLRRLELAERRLAPIQERFERLEERRADLESERETMSRREDAMLLDPNMSQEEREQLRRAGEVYETELGARIEELDARLRSVQGELALREAEYDRLERLLDRQLSGR